MKPHNSKRSTICILTTLACTPGWEILNGIFDFLDTHLPNHDIRIFVDEERPLTTADIADGVEFAGFIVATIPSPETVSAIAALDIPIVTLGVSIPEIEVRRTNTAIIRNDSESIGQLAVKHLLGCGHFNAFGFIPDAGNTTTGHWSDEREIAFSRELQRHGLRLHLKRDEQSLADYLIMLPKPAAVLMACDRLYPRVLSACERSGISIPSQLTILSIDNDRIRCRHTRPTLSSIQPGHTEMGTAAAKELAKMIHARKPSNTRIIVIPPVDVFHRQSTHPITPSATLVDDAKSFIRENAEKGIKVVDLVRHLNVSRSLAEMRFKAIEGKSLREAIEDEKLRLAQQMLKNSDRNVISIAHECGFHSANRLSRVFKRRFGMSIRDWRTSIPKS